MSLPVTLRRAAEADIPFVMAAERGVGYEALVGRWDRDRHLAALSDGSHACFVGEMGGMPAGFVLLRFWNAPERVTLVRRIAVVSPGRGHGRALLAAAIDRTFAETEAYRIQIGLFPENHRARRAYEAVGFRAEGISRGSAFFGGVHRDELVMALLRPEWEARS